MSRFSVILLAISLAMSAGCSKPDDTTYLTPIPLATWQTYTAGAPISSKLEAVIAARPNFDFHLLNVSEPIPLFANEMNLEDANDLISHTDAKYSADRPRDMRVWMVIFEGDWQVVPPPLAGGEIPTLEHPKHGCVFVLLKAANGNTIEIGDGPCIR